MSENKITEKEIFSDTMKELHDKIKINAKKGWHLAEPPKYILKNTKNIYKVKMTKNANDIYVNSLELVS